MKLKFQRMIWVILSFVMVTFRNNHSNLTEESHKEQLGSISVGASSHRQDGCLPLSGLGKTGNLLKYITSQLILKLKFKRGINCLYPSVWLSCQLLIMKTYMVLHKENDFFFRSDLKSFKESGH